MSEIDKELAELEKKIQEQNNSKPQPDPQKEEVATPPEVEAVAEPVRPETQAPVTQEEVTELEKKKGWKSKDDAIASYQNLEKKFHEQAQEISRLRNQQPEYPAVPPYMPPVAPQGYMPPPNPYVRQDQRAMEENMAASYGVTVDDFRKIVAIQRDIASAMNRQQAQEFNQRLEAISLQNEKTSDMAEVSSDPAFQNPDVQTEMHEILSKNPTLFGQRKPYSSALNQALANIGRKNAMRGNSGSSALPTEPPRAPSGNGSSFSSRKVGGIPDSRMLNNMKPEDLEKMLKGLGAFKTYEDLA